jgi:hypothetical protein
MADIEWKPLPTGLWTPPAVFVRWETYPSGVYRRWRADLGDQQKDRGTRRMEYHRQGHCRLLRGGQSGGALRSGSGIVRTTEGAPGANEGRPPHTALPSNQRARSAAHRSALAYDFEQIVQLPQTGRRSTVGATAARRSANRASRSRDALAQLRVIEEVLGETVYSLALAVIVEERSFILSPSASNSAAMPGR